MADAPARKKSPVRHWTPRRTGGEPITQLAAHDFRTAVFEDRLGIDILSVSDRDTVWPRELPVSFDERLNGMDRSCAIGASIFAEQTVENVGRRGTPEECKAFATEIKWDRKLEELESPPRKTA